MRDPRCLLLALLLSLPTAAFAANPHFQSGPTFTISNNQITACGSIVGLGNQDVTITLTATADVQCINKGGNPPPGQRTTASGTATHLRPDNGHLDFCVTTDRINSGCPKPMSFTVTFSDVKLTVSQGGQVVLSGQYQP